MPSFLLAFCLYLGELRAALEDTIEEGLTQVVVVEAEAGVGKSRLGAELRREVEGARVLMTTTSPLSRGAAETVFVDRAPVVLQQLRANLALLDCDRGRTVCMDAGRYLEGPASCWDVVFLDPPFDEDLVGRACELIDRSGVLSENGLVYVEEQKSRPRPELPAGWAVWKERTAGNVRYALVTVGA